METANSPALLVLDLPPSALAGIDLLSFTVTPRFKGIKDLPSGFHFVFAGATSTFSERHGLWLHIPAKRDWQSLVPLAVAKWDPTSETLQFESDEAEVLRWRANLGSLWRGYLTPYRQTAVAEEKAKTDFAVETSVAEPKLSSNDNEDGDVDLDASSDWPALTSAITAPVLARITGTANDKAWHMTSASSARCDIEDIPGLASQPGTQPSPTDSTSTSRHLAALPAESLLSLLPIDLKRTWRPGATGRERTEGARDRSWALEHLAQASTADNSSPAAGVLRDTVLGELQFTFLMALTLGNFSCSEQWQRLLVLILTSRAAIANHSDFFVGVLATLRLQLQRLSSETAANTGATLLLDFAAERDADDDNGPGDVWLKALLEGFRSSLDELAAGDVGSSSGGASPDDLALALADVRDELVDLQDYLRRAHGWRFEPRLGTGIGNGSSSGGPTRVPAGSAQSEPRQTFARRGNVMLEDGEWVELHTTAYDAECEMGEFAPMVVDLSAEQRRLLLGEEGDDGDQAGVDGGGDHHSRPGYNQGERASVTVLDSNSEQDNDEEEDEDEDEDDQDLDDMDARY